MRGMIFWLVSIPPGIAAKKLPGTNDDEWNGSETGGFSNLNNTDDYQTYDIVPGARQSVARRKEDVLRQAIVARMHRCESCRLQRIRSSLEVERAAHDGYARPNCRRSG